MNYCYHVQLCANYMHTCVCVHMHMHGVLKLYMIQQIDT